MMKNDDFLRQAFQPDFISIETHARLLNISVRYVANRAAAGTWIAKTVLFGRRRLVPMVEHERVVRELLAGADVVQRRVVEAAFDDHDRRPLEYAEGRPLRRGRPRK